MSRFPDKRSKLLLVSALLGVTCVAAYWGVWNHEFVNYDDGDYVTQNIQVQSGLTLQGVAWAFTTGHAGNWHPLTWLSLMLDHELFGLNPWGYHVTSLLFHVASTLLLFYVLRRMTQETWKSAFVAALFGLHPLHVESVAWIAERKDVLSAAFFMLTLLFYARYVERPVRKRYLLVLLSLALGLMSKPMLVTLPFVLLLLDVWPLGRIRFGSDEGKGKMKGRDQLGAKERGAIIKKLVREKVPFFLLIIGSSVATVIAQRGEGAVVPWEMLPFMSRLQNAISSYLKYLLHMVWPSNLSAFYPHPGFEPPFWQVAGSAAMLLIVSFFLMKNISRRPYLFVGWFWYLGTLVPVIGLIQVGFQSMADRYTYIPLIGIFMMIAWGVPNLFSKQKEWRIALSVSAVLILLALSIRTQFQVRTWENSFTLWQNALHATTNNGLAHYNVGLQLAKQGKTAEAIEHYTEAVRIIPDMDEAHDNLANLLAREGRNDEALYHYRELQKLKPNSDMVYYNLGILYLRLGKTPEALDSYSRAVQMNPRNWRAHQSLGTLLIQQGRFSDGIGHLEEALRLEPNSPERRVAIANLLAEHGMRAEAIRHYTEALKLKPNDAEVHNSLGLALARDGKIAEAIEHFKEALRLGLNVYEVHANLGLAYTRQENYEMAVEHYREALKLRPNDAKVGEQLQRALDAQKRSRSRQRPPNP
jgi:tetratricopeptide (TPR) repeat protein